MSDNMISEQLIEKWDQKGFKLSEIKRDDVRSTTAQLLENQHKYMSGMLGEATLTSDIAQFKKVLMPLARRIMPNLIANEIVGVQPMTGPVGQAFALRYYADTTKGNYTKDVTELGYNTVDKDYTGSVPALTADRWDSKDPSAIATIPKAKLKVDQSTVNAETRMIKTEYNLQAAQDLQAMHGESLEARMVEFLQYEIQQEIDRELIDKINTLGAVAGLSTHVVSAGDGQWESEKFRVLFTRIEKEAREIGRLTRRGAGNVIIASANVITALESLANFSINPVSGGPLEISPGISKVGTIGNRYSVYNDTFATSDYATVGYKGPGNQDSGVFFMPYIPLMMAKTVQEDNPFIPVLALMTRYGILDNLFGSQNYYRRLPVDFNGVF